MLWASLALGTMTIEVERSHAVLLPERGSALPDPSGNDHKGPPHGTSRYEFSVPQTFGTFGAWGSFHHSFPFTRNLYS